MWTYQEGEGWSPDQQLPLNLSDFGPSLAGGSSLDCVFAGAKGDSRLYLTRYDHINGWIVAQALPNHYSAAAPAVARYQNKLYCVHRGGKDDEQLWWATYGDQGSGVNEWSADQSFPAHKSSTTPALAVFQDKLYCVHRGAVDDAQMYWTCWDGSSWSADRPVGGWTSSHAPALAVYRDTRRQPCLVCVHRLDDGSLNLIRFTGSDWRPGLNDYPTTLPGKTAKAPALAVFGGDLHCVQRGNGDDKNLYISTMVQGSHSWYGPLRMGESVASAEGASLTVYRAPDGTKDQLFCMHRGV
ncbi:hypothetical protein [Nocardiopsis gilva]|uniref:hypothetical protein n=1 Tax=Nocardiopsis gilva TaxID=280236 RepID=UPI00034D0EC1|nr:hypothetical protein [Nocardiopsis gilva]